MYLVPAVDLGDITILSCGSKWSSPTKMTKQSHLIPKITEVFEKD